MLFDPVVALVFLVCKHCRWRFFLYAGGDGEAAGSGTDDDYIVDVTVGMHLDGGGEMNDAKIKVYPGEDKSIFKLT